MELSSEAVLELLDLYESESVLWDPKHPLHRNRNEVNDSWKRIQKSFSVECSIDELKKKRDSLMATFRPLLKKVKSSTKSGSGSADVFKPAWFAFERMAKFLKSVYEVRQTRNTEELVENAEQDREYEDQENLETEDPTIINNPIDSYSSDADNVKPSMLKGSKKRKLMSLENVQVQMNDAYKIMKTVADKKSKKDSCSMYTDLLNMKLREFDEFNRAILMNEIDNLVFRAKMRLNQPHPSTYSTFTSQQLPVPTVPVTTFNPIHPHTQSFMHSPSFLTHSSSPEFYTHSPNVPERNLALQSSSSSLYSEYTEVSPEHTASPNETRFNM